MTLIFWKISFQTVFSNKLSNIMLLFPVTLQQHAQYTYEIIDLVQE